MLGFKVGRGCHVSMFSIVVADRIELGPGAVIAPLTMVYRPTHFSMGERSRIGGFVRIIGWHGNVLLGPQTFVAVGCLIDGTGGFELGERSQIGPRCTLYSHGATGLIFNMRYPHRNGPIRIGADCWLGMGCIVHPQVVVGDRVIMLPGITVRGNVPPDTAVLPPTAEHRTVSASRLLIGVTDEVRREKMDDMLRLCATHFRGSRLDESSSDLWRLLLAGGNKVYLIREDSATIDPAEIVVARSVIWTLFEHTVAPGPPTFCFERLTVFNGWTPFAEEIAAFLCEYGGAHFTFQRETHRNHDSRMNAK
jgi:acetyltransferase-like isoleucine patch superfamily enzyme